MKILHTLAQLPTRTGSGVYFSNLVDGLEKKGMEQALIYAVQEPYSFDFSQKTFPVTFQTDEIPFPIAGMSDEMPYKNTVYSEMTEEMIATWRAAFKKRLLEAKEKFQPDLIVAHHLWYLTDMVLEIFPDIPVVGVCHGTDLRQGEKHDDLLERYTTHMNELDYVFALSEKDKAAISRMYAIPENKITVTGGGYNQVVFNDQGIWRHEKTIKIIYAGKLSRAKGVYELAKAYPNLKRKYPEIEMELIGEESLEKKDRIFECAHYKEGFKIHNVIDQKALGAHMKTCDIFVLPSYYEGLGLIAIEALACRMRLVTSELEGLLELLGDDFLKSDVVEVVPLPRLYNTDEPYKLEIDDYVQGLEAAIEKQILNLRDERPFSDDCYEHVRSYAWSEIVETEYRLMCEVYKNYEEKRA
ncbi:glycosyltransferase, group 1 family protein [Aedoeadaptatus nemausensis]|uniref:Glycosyltransferase, group 1 family protein n=1 Tax=Aedoeadaptatus nemausensis TaxID=2582829 RepID=A0A6V6Y4H0_9FIRM|nr:glycosyltransferase family 4 protein [Peptoniphilus nemausensis]CAC9932117.1 glycosyltransferase, group 1 family protein [Peptoniphilus nemausensis]